VRAKVAYKVTLTSIDPSGEKVSTAKTFKPTARKAKRKK
jgi:hypothetical protein